MRLNKFLADNTDLSRRKADTAIENGHVRVNGDVAVLGMVIDADDKVYLDNYLVKPLEKSKNVTILLNKPVGYVCSKNGQGSPTVYDLLPAKYSGLNIAGRLDKDSSGLVVLTNDGVLLNELTHPSSNKEKIYAVTMDKELTPRDVSKLTKGVDIGDERLSRFKKIKKIDNLTYKVTMEEGRNRQIRRTFEAMNYEVAQLHREQLGQYKIDNLKEKETMVL